MLSRRTFLTATAVTLAATPWSTAVMADDIGPIFTRWGTAIRGADPVAYFTQGQPVYGERDITHVWGGATWRFASTENRDLFAADPEAYAPQYGGNCAWAVSQGYTASTIPEAWKIVDGKLYLNYSHSVQGRWETDIPGHIASGDTNWPKIVADEG